MSASSSFSLDCTKCPRLSEFLSQLRNQFPDYHNRPVAPFGGHQARFLIVGLAPGMHGANATGRPFTGDYAGELLYNALYQFGFANQAYEVERGTIHVNDGLQLTNCRITNAVKCLPPGNKPLTEEINMCNAYLRDELMGLPENSVVLSLGLIAHKAVLKAMGFKQSVCKFGHGSQHQLQTDEQSLLLINSYHCSRYNTNTKRLTTEMFHQVFEDIVQRLAKN